MLTNIGDIARQGDLYIQLVAEIPEGAKPCKARDAKVLAYGETGTHHHEIVCERVEVFERPSAEALVTDADAVDLRERFLRIEAEAESRVMGDISRHAPIKIPAGSVIRTWIQREWQPEAIQRVYD